MQSYTIDTPDGASYKVEAENDQQAQSAIESYLPSSQPSPLDKAATNVVPDIKQMVSGLVSHVAESPGMDIASGDVAAAIPKIVKQGKEFLSNPKENAAQLARPVLHPVDYFQEHPVQQALNVLGAGQLAARGAGAALNAVPLTENVVPSLEEIANNQTLKGFGGTMGQLKQMSESGGRPALDAAAQYARKTGLSDVFTTSMGRTKQLEALLKATGKKLGALRQEAGAASPNIVNDVLANPKANLDQYLGEGLASGELPQVDKALADIKRIAGDNPTHENLAKAATYINQQAAGTKLYQPVTAATDLANALSDENNQGIARALGSDKAKQYVDTLDEQKTIHPLEHLQQRGELRQAGGRGGIGLQMVQKLADEFGYRLSAKTAAAIHDSLVSNAVPITKAAVANKLAGLNTSTPITSLIQQLVDKYAQRKQM